MFSPSVSRPLLAVAVAALTQPALAQEAAPEAVTLRPLVVTAPCPPGTPTHPSNADAEAAHAGLPYRF